MTDFERHLVWQSMIEIQQSVTMADKALANEDGEGAAQELARIDDIAKMIGEAAHAG